MITVKIQDGTAFLYTPYNPNFVAAIKKIGGARWNSSERAWTIPAYAIEDARTIMRKVYGECDLPNDSPKVTVKLSFSEKVVEYCGPVTIMGKIIASAKGRDSGASVGDDVVFIEGSPESGGSRVNWTTVVPSGSVVVLHGVPSEILEEKLPEGVTFEVISESKPDRAALLRERERLLARLAEIDKELEEA